MNTLKLQALDLQDLNIVSAHLQDAVLRVGDMAYVPREKRFAVLMNRFDWTTAKGNQNDGKKQFERRRSALRVERVLRAQLLNIDLDAPDVVLELLAIEYKAASPPEPEGTITLLFAGGGAVQLDVECIEAELKDLGPIWRTHNRPEHNADGQPEPDEPQDAETSNSDV